MTPNHIDFRLSISSCSPLLQARAWIEPAALAANHAGAQPVPGRCGFDDAPAGQGQATAGAGQPAGILSGVGREEAGPIARKAK